MLISGLKGLSPRSWTNITLWVLIKINDLNVLPTSVRLLHNLV